MDKIEISYQTLRETLTQVIKEKILNGDFPPGEKINEKQLADQLSVSRGPVREALRQIEQEGLVTYAQNRGCTVSVLTADDMEEMYLLRSTLESLAIRICGARLDEARRATLRKAIQGMEQAAAAGNLKEIVDYDQMFHRELVLACGKKRLYTMWSSTDGANTSTYFTMKNAGMMPYAHLAHNHQIILDALDGGNVEEICQKIQEHYLVVPEYLKSHGEKNKQPTRRSP